MGVSGVLVPIQYGGTTRRRRGIQIILNDVIENPGNFRTIRGPSFPKEVIVVSGGSRRDLSQGEVHGGQR